MDGQQPQIIYLEGLEALNPEVTQTIADEHDNARQQKLLKLKDALLSHFEDNPYSAKIRQRTSLSLPFAPNPLSWRGQQTNLLTGE